MFKKVAYIVVEKFKLRFNDSSVEVESWQDFMNDYILPKDVPIFNRYDIALNKKPSSCSICHRYKILFNKKIDRNLTVQDIVNMRDNFSVFHIQINYIYMNIKTLEKMISTISTVYDKETNKEILELGIQGTLFAMHIVAYNFIPNNVILFLSDKIYNSAGFLTFETGGL